MTPSREAIEAAWNAYVDASVDETETCLACMRHALTAAYALDFPQPSKRDEEIWRDLCEKDDRTSPAEYPDMALISFDELAAIRAEAALAERERCAKAAFRFENSPHNTTNVVRFIAAAIRKGE